MSPLAKKPKFDPVIVTPSTHKAVLDNYATRVLDIRLKPGATAPMHSHPDYVVYALTPFKARFRFPDGKSEIVEAEAGTVVWRDAETHAVDNLGPNEIHVLNVEFKQQREAEERGAA